MKTAVLLVHSIPSSLIKGRVSRRSRQQTVANSEDTNSGCFDFRCQLSILYPASAPTCIEDVKCTCN